MHTFEQVYKMDNLFGIWNYSNQLRVTYVTQGWLIVWDHQQSPPIRYDCKHQDHQQACAVAIAKLQEISNT